MFNVEDSISVKWSIMGRGSSNILTVHAINIILLIYHNSIWKLLFLTSIFLLQCSIMYNNIILYIILELKLAMTNYSSVIFVFFGAERK